MTSNFSLPDLKNHKKWCNPIIFGKLIPDHFCLFNLFQVFRVPTVSRMAPPRGALFSLQALLGAPGEPYRSLKGARVLDMRSNRWHLVQILPPKDVRGPQGPLQHSWSHQKGPPWPQRALIGGPGGPRTTPRGQIWAQMPAVSPSRWTT